jgi:hypothetical protein
MGILKYIPKKREIIDNRSSEGGFYEAECDECKEPFYPKRSNAKYCSRSCLVMAYRKNKTSETPKKLKKIITPSKPSQIESKPTQIGLPKMVHETTGRNMASYLKNKYKSDTEGKPIYLLNEELQRMSINSKIEYGTIYINRRSAYKFQLFIKP